MDIDEACNLDLTAVAERLRTGAISSVALTEAMLARISRLDPKLKSYATVTPDLALDQARAADEALAAGRTLGPLHGVPIAVKDLCWTKGIPTAAGTTIHRDFRPSRDATVVARLAAAGAVLLGKLQMTEGAFGTHHPKVAPPVNPWNAAHYVGVSSSGSGAATAASLCFGSLGSDTGGSIRFPSTMNGITGLKPTWGRVSRFGVFALADSMDHVGPMTRSAADAAAMLGVIAGADRDDPTAVPDPVPDYMAALGQPVRGLRIGIDRRFNGENVEPDVVRVTEDAAAALADLGATVIDVRVPSVDDVVAGWTVLCGIECALAHEATYPARAGDYGPRLAWLIDLGRRASGLDMARIEGHRARLRGEMAGLFAGIDLLLVPVMPTASPTIAQIEGEASQPEARLRRLRFTAPFDMTGQPTITLPGGATAAGMPVGFQLVGRSLDEATVLRAGHAFQTATDWHKRRPPVQ
jgi:amidase